MLVKSIDKRYLNRAVIAANKFYRITHEDPAFDSALECAGFHLNELGMNLFNAAIMEFEKRVSNLLVVRDADGGIIGVKETYRKQGSPEGITVEYQTSPDDCTCRRFLKKGICLHMIMVRLESGLPLFSTSMFLRGRLLKDLTAYDHINESPAREAQETLEEPSDADVYTTDHTEVAKHPGTEKDKWNLANEITKEITENVARYHGDDFKKALRFLEEIEKLTRTNGFSEQLISYLKAPDKYILVTPDQITQLNSQIQFYNNLVSIPIDDPPNIQVDASPSSQNRDIPQTPTRPHGRAWPPNPFPTLDSPSRFVYHPPVTPTNATTRTRTPVTPTRTPSSQLSPQARVHRFSHPPLSPLVSATPDHPQRSPAMSPLFRTPGLIQRVRPRPPYHTSRPKLPIRMSPELLKMFIKLSTSNSNIGIETGGILGGFLSANKSFYTMDHLFIPDQVGFPTSYNDTNSEDCALLMVQRNRLNLGTIHTHPGHLESFMSSVDLHMHCQIQKDVNSAIAFVHSPRYKTTPAYSLTDFGIGNLHNVL
jgi:hypothetical protein